VRFRVDAAGCNRPPAAGRTWAAIIDALVNFRADIPVAVRARPSCWPSSAWSFPVDDCYLPCCRASSMLSLQPLIISLPYGVWGPDVGL
jgi:hypothetical protein